MSQEVKYMLLRVDKIEAETPNALGVLDTKGNIQWLPKSRINFSAKKVRGKIEIEVPKWLADKQETLEFEEL